jgi:hypothetical protein
MFRAGLGQIGQFQTTNYMLKNMDTGDISSMENQILVMGVGQNSYSFCAISKTINTSGIGQLELMY